MNVHDGIWRLPCVVVRVKDADTIVVDADLGWFVWKRNLTVRVDRLWAPENATAAGKAATVWAKGTLPAGQPLTLHSRWVTTFERVVGSLFFPEGGDYAEIAAAAGHGELR